MFSKDTNINYISVDTVPLLSLLKVLEWPKRQDKSLHSENMINLSVSSFIEQSRIPYENICPFSFVLPKLKHTSKPRQ